MLYIKKIWPVLNEFSYFCNGISYLKISPVMHFETRSSWDYMVPNFQNFQKISEIVETFQLLGKVSAFWTLTMSLSGIKGKRKGCCKAVKRPH